MRRQQLRQPGSKVHGCCRPAPRDGALHIIERERETSRTEKEETDKKWRGRNHFVQGNVQAGAIKPASNGQTPVAMRPAGQQLGTDYNYPAAKEL